MSCPQCDNPFYARDSRQIYCSASCRVQACRSRNEVATLGSWKSRQWLPDPIPAPPSWPHHEIPVVIVAHPRRMERVNGIADEIFTEAVVVDDNHYGCEINHLRALEWLAAGNCPWSVVLEDDALPIARFRYQLHAALAVAPTPIVGLYLGRMRPPHWQYRIAEAIGRARLDDVCFLRASALLHGVGYAIRTALIPDLLSVLPARIHQIPIDEAITAWAAERGHAISYTWPSLLDHRDEPSLISHRDGQPRRRGRVAWYADGRKSWQRTWGEIADPELIRHEEAG